MVGRPALTGHLLALPSVQQPFLWCCLCSADLSQIVETTTKTVCVSLKKKPKQNQKAKQTLDLFTDLLYSTAGVVQVLVHCHTWTQQMTQIKLTLLLMCHETLLRFMVLFQFPFFTEDSHCLFIQSLENYLQSCWRIKLLLLHY